ncbi:hypothetical protein HPB47_009314 [Ixodes persulcatus]|uniref:Uncharacterized protein n=1 Tax=Ixodes persulcatus TaxID=34615 RepID=A0AC60P294_IXOPE|nr:hypothetical protein HPB47_009314 [Ixodes persulcatus]
MTNEQADGSPRATSARSWPSGHERDISSVHLRLPKYWASDTEAWFAQIESHFSTYRISFQNLIFHHVVAVIPPDIATEHRLQQLLTCEKLGDRKTSQLLRRLQQHLGDRALSFDTLLLKELFLQRLPTNVLMVLATASDLQMTTRAQLADSLMDVATPQVSQLQETQESTKPRMASAPSILSSEMRILRDVFYRELKRNIDNIAALSISIAAT